MTFSPAGPLSIRPAVSQALADFLANQEEAVAGARAQPLLHQAHQLAEGGKRLRPAFCYWGHVAAAGQPDPAQPLIRAAASLDLLHASALVHDDLIDQSDTRRGSPAAHRHFATLTEPHNHQFGDAAAIILGDLLMLWSADMFDGSGLERAAVERALPYLHHMRTEVTCGQYLDIAAAFKAEVPQDHNDALTIATSILDYKSASYSVRRPAQLGAALGDAPQSLIEALGEFGLNVGRAFQLRDDILGVFGDPSITGKPAGDDLREGKQTVLLLSAHHDTDDAGRAVLEASLGASDADVDAAREVIEASGARSRVEQLIDHYWGMALQALDIEMHPEGKTALTALAEASVRRDA